MARNKVLTMYILKNHSATVIFICIKSFTSVLSDASFSLPEMPETPDQYDQRSLRSAVLAKLMHSIKWLLPRTSK